MIEFSALIAAVPLFIGILALWAPPRVVLLGVSTVAAGTIGWQAIGRYQALKWCDRIEAAHVRYDLHSSPVRIAVFEPEMGLSVTVNTRNGDAQRRGLENCDWQVRDSAGKLLRCNVGSTLLFNEQADEFGERTWIEVTYREDDATRDLLRGVYLEARPSNLALITASYRPLVLWQTIGFAVATLVAAAGSIAQFAKLRRTRRPREQSAPSQLAE